MYGFSHTGARAMLWSHIAQAELPEAEWVLAGDFNNIEQLRDKQGGSNKTNIRHRELESWNKLLTRLGVQDAHNLGSFFRQSDKSFTWTNAHNDESMIQLRIDRIYVPNRIDNIGGTTHILPTLPDISDHAGVVLHFNDEGKQKAQPPYFNKGLLMNAGSRYELLETWKRVMADNDMESWNLKMVKANEAIRLRAAELTKNQRKSWRETYQAQFEEIIEAEAELQRNWGSQAARDQLSDAQAALHEVRHQKFQYQESAILSKWARVGDRCTKEFFEHHASSRKPTVINKMMDGERTITAQTEIEEHILAFYQALYSRDEQVEQNEAAREDCFQYLRPTVTEEHNQELLQPITMDEVALAMKQLPAGKAPV